jgi:hypothetical protein
MVASIYDSIASPEDPDEMADESSTLLADKGDKMTTAPPSRRNHALWIAAAGMLVVLVMMATAGSSSPPTEQDDLTAASFSLWGRPRAAYRSSSARGVR